jgi:hypothetical protein
LFIVPLLEEQFACHIMGIGVLCHIEMWELPLVALIWKDFHSRI